MSFFWQQPLLKRKLLYKNNIQISKDYVAIEFSSEQPKHV